MHPLGGLFMSQSELLIRKIMDTKHVRSLRIERAETPSDAGEDNRTVELSFASDIPHEHFLWSSWEYVDIALSMDPKAVRTERLSAGAPLLMDHNTRDMVGVIEAFSIEKKEGKARATVRFSESPRGEEIYKDVLGGIRQCVSVGFMIHKLTLKEQRDRKKGEIDLYEAQDWEPYEISIVAVPADISVGVGRSDDLGLSPEQAEAIVDRIAAKLSKPSPTERANSKNEEKQMTPEEIAAQKAAEAARSVETPRTAAQLIRDEIVEWGDTFAKLGNSRDQKSTADYLALCAANGTEPAMDAWRAALKAATPANVQVPAMDPHTAAERNGAGPQNVQLARTLPRYGKLKAFKGEHAEERAYRFGQFILGGPLGHENAREFCRTNGIKIERAQSEGINEKGGYLVPEDFGNDMIDLIEKYGVFRNNAKIRPMSRDTASDPRITGELDAYFVGESATGTESDFETDRVSLTAKKLMTLVVYSSEVSEDAVINMGDEIAMLSGRAFAKKEDNCGFNGDGSGTYGGIIGAREKLKGLSGTIANIAGLQVGTGNAYSELVLADFRGVVAKLPEYADDGAAWYVHRSFYWNVMVGALLAAGGVTATEIENTRNQIFLGYPVRFSQIMPKVEANSQVCALFGDLAMGATLGDRRQYSIALSEHARFTADDTVFKATSRFDINVHSVGNASATAADREPGPIVGLITAAS